MRPSWKLGTGSNFSWSTEEKSPDDQYWTEFSELIKILRTNFDEKVNPLDTIIKIHESLKSNTNALPKISTNIQNSNALDILINTFVIFSDEEIKTRSLKSITLILNCCQGTADIFVKKCNAFELLIPLFDISSPLFPPACVAMQNILMVPDFIQQNMTPEIFNVFWNDILEISKNTHQLLENDILAKASCILLQIFNLCVQNLPNEAVIEQAKNYIPVILNFMTDNIFQLFRPCLLLIRKIQSKINFKIIEEYELNDMLFTILLNPSLYSVYDIVINLMIADFPFKIDFEKVPIERLIEILQGHEKPSEISKEKQDSISFLIVLLFQTFFSESNSYPLIITSPDVIKIIIEFAQNTNAKYCVGCTEFFLSILSKISAEDIMNYLEDFPDISELIVNCLEYDNPDAQKLIQYVYTFLKHVTDMGATDHEIIADLIAQMQDPISELCDSEEGKTRAYAATVLKYYYPDVFDSKYI